MSEPTWERPHRRFNPLAGRHVLVSPHRMRRPWQGQREPAQEPRLPAHDPGCYLCPGNLRASGKRNPDYVGPFVFDNDYPALSSKASTPSDSGDELLAASAVRGTARVVCYAPDHGATLADLPVAEIGAVVRLWTEQSAALGGEYCCVQIFENKGAMMGASNPHPHGQIWATDFVPDEIAVEGDRQRAWHVRHGRPMLLDVAEREIERGERVVAANGRWVALVPFWAAWPFEILLLPRFPIARLPDLGDGDGDALAQILSEVAIRYDNLFQTHFPYSMGWHGAPFGAADPAGWQLHAHFYPPLLRSAAVRKFMVGFELLAEAQRDLTPEAAAAQLREAGARLYRSGRR